MDKLDATDTRACLARLKGALCDERSAFIAVWLVAEDAIALRRDGIDHDALRSASVEFFRGSKIAMDEVQYLVDELDNIAPEGEPDAGKAAP